MIKSKKQKAKLTPYFFKKKISRCFIESKITIKKANKNTLPISNLNQFIIKDHLIKKGQKKEIKHCVNSQYFLSGTILFQPISFRFLLIYLFIYFIYNE